MLDTLKVFENQYQIYLKSINFDISDKDVGESINVLCYDNINVIVDGDIADIKLTRLVEAKIFSLSVTMGAKLKFRSDCETRPSQNEIEKNIASTNIAVNIFARISLIISQISSSYGQEPLITPPLFMKKPNTNKG